MRPIIQQWLNCEAGRVLFRWLPSDPLAVLLRFDDSKNKTEWFIERDLLIAGCSTWSGVGDVRLGPVRYRPWAVEVHLGHGDDVAMIRFNRAEFMSFLCATEMVIPRGHEVLDIEDELSSLLDGF